MNRDALDRLVEIGELKIEPPSKKEFDGLVLSGRRRLKDAQNDSLSWESRFDLAYNSAHAFALAALRWHRYRSESRYLVFQCLKHTLDLSNKEWRVLDHAHKKRNQVEYEGKVDIDAALVEALLRVILVVEERVVSLSR